MENIKRLLRIVFQTANEITFPVSGTGSSGMETALMNLVEDGDEVVVAAAGVFGERFCDAARTAGREGPSRRGGMGQNRRAGAHRGGAQGREQT